METGVFMFGAVDGMKDAGSGPPAPTDRRFTQKEMWDAATKLLDMGVAADALEAGRWPEVEEVRFEALPARYGYRLHPQATTRVS